MLNAKLNINGFDIQISGDKEDIVYVLKNTTSSSMNVREKDIVARINSKSKIDEEKKPKYSKEDLIRMYQYLASQGNYQIKQFEITRGGKLNPIRYTVCLVFNQDEQRYIYYNPKSEDRYIETYSINDVLTKINASESGFSLLHTVANRLMDKLSLIDGMKKIISSKEKIDPFKNEEFSFKNYESKDSLYDDSVEWIKTHRGIFNSRKLNLFLKQQGYKGSGKLKRNIARLCEKGILRHISLQDKRLVNKSKASVYSKWYEAA